MNRTFSHAGPSIHPSCFIHDSAEIIGRVDLAPRVSVWPYSVLRGDVDKIVIGENTNIQDHTVIHCRERRPTIVGKGVTVGHRVILHGCEIGDGCLIGMGSIVMEATIGPRCLIAAGALILAGMTIPAESLVMGAPARPRRKLTRKELASLRQSELSYMRLAERHRKTSRLWFPAAR
ncbi:MAG: gamma carbonic anhydrase family protein [Elusimicrobia bacterium]|nr:gamma carbonic anhydrase family protein [Elusimicrobiota bacterium]